MMKISSVKKVNEFEEKLIEAKSDPELAERMKVIKEMELRYQEALKVLKK